MALMNPFRRRRSVIWPMVLASLCALLGEVGCSRPTGVPTADTTPADQAPFNDHGSGAAGPSAVEPSAAQPGGSSQTGLPFHDSQSLPAGTMLTIRLKGPVTVGDSAAEASFEAVIDEPVVIEGNTLIPRGTAASGRIESARISKVKPNRGYVRLALESVQIGGLDVPVQTASLFARQTPQNDAVIRLEKGRRLTFRLTEPLYVSTQRAQAGH